MRSFKLKLLLVGVLTVLSALPVQAFGRHRGGGCQCQQAPAQGGCGQAVQYGQAVQSQGTVVVTTSYQPPAVADGTGYMPITLNGQPLPTSCGPGGCLLPGRIPPAGPVPSGNGAFFSPTESDCDQA